jgi:hypothetical protein
MLSPIIAGRAARQKKSHQPEIITYRHAWLMALSEATIMASVEMFVQMRAALGSPALGNAWRPCDGVNIIAQGNA